MLVTISVYLFIKLLFLYLRYSGKQPRYFDDQATINIGGRGSGNGVRQRKNVERSFVGVISGLNYNDYKILDMAASGDARVTIDGDLRQVLNPEGYIFSSLPPTLADRSFTGSSTPTPSFTASPSGDTDEKTEGRPTPTRVRSSG